MVLYYNVVNSQNIGYRCWKLGDLISDTPLTPICAQNKLRDPGVRQMETKMASLFIYKAFWQTRLKCADLMGFQTLQSRIRRTSTARGRAREGGLSPGELSL